MGELVRVEDRADGARRARRRNVEADDVDEPALWVERPVAGLAVDPDGLERDAPVVDLLTSPLGMFAEIPLLERIVPLRPANWLLIVSDGIPEACDANDREFGDDRLLALLQPSPASAFDFCHETIAAVTAFSGNNPNDDLTVLAARVLTS